MIHTYINIPIFKIAISRVFAHNKSIYYIYRQFVCSYTFLHVDLYMGIHCEISKA